ncbi:MAG: ribosomal small subunit pseudouridine synthase [Firmicutes bacterium]|nr:ribosomal small subunit pseudouridine synthase [Bacillota bacterium]
MRLDRCLANAGFGSRTEVKELIRRGQVTVAGQPVRDAGFDISDELAKTVAVSGESVLVRRHIHLMLHKPAGLVTALEDRHLRTIAELVPVQLWQRGLFPVGRLDRDTTGLLILTTDGTLGHRLASPRWEVWKTYEVTVEGAPFSEADVVAFAEGLNLQDGLVCQPAKLEPHSDYQADLTIHEGKFHQVKRMMLSTGRTVTALHRRSVGNLVLDEQLAPGTWRELSEAEIAGLYGLVELEIQDASH